MLSTIKVIASLAATAIALIAYIPYLIDMFRGKNRPHLYTWISISLVTAIVAYLQLICGAGLGAIPTIVGVLIHSVLRSLRFSAGMESILASCVVEI